MGLCLYGKVSDITKSVRKNFDEYWVPILAIVKSGYLSYTEAINLNINEVYELSYAIQKYEELISE